MNSKSDFISIVLPVYREAEHLGSLLDSIRDSLEEVDAEAEMTMVDDGSTDRTGECHNETGRIASFHSRVAIKAQFWERPRIMCWDRNGTGRGDVRYYV